SASKNMSSETEKTAKANEVKRAKNITAIKQKVTDVKSRNVDDEMTGLNQVNESKTTNRTNEDMLALRTALESAFNGLGRPIANETIPREFVRRFRRKYCSVVKDGKTLIEILGDDHLNGRAKNLFLAIPEHIKQQGFEAVIEELNKILAHDSTAARIRALTDLRNLRIRPCQSIVDFCVVLENLGKKANPESTIEDKSMEYAQIVLENLKDWPEQVQILNALHSVEPRHAYEKIKELAISIEQAKMFNSKHGKPFTTRPRQNWRVRASDYERKDRHDEEIRNKYQNGRKESSGNVNIPSTRARIPRATDSSMTKERYDPHKNNNHSRKCYNCNEYGHIAWQCPLKEARVSQVSHDSEERTWGNQRKPLTTMIKEIQSMGIRTERKIAPKTDIIGEKLTRTAELLNCQVQALIDSGSMISIIPLQILATAHQKGFDIETLKREDDNRIETVYDASNHPMTFLGIVWIHVKLQDGISSDVAFHISKEKSNEILLGTNALKKLGVQIVMEPTSREQQKSETNDIPPSSVLAADRITVPALCVRLVTAVCDIAKESTKGIIWAAKQGINSGVYKVRNKKITLPIQNREHEPMVIKKGEKLGEWGTEKWLTKWEDCTMLDQENFEMNTNEKQKLLREQILQNRKEKCIEQDLTDLLVNYADVFAVCEKELSQTDLVKMSIDTGESQPIKLKTRPVPLGLRKRLREMLQDLEDRNIIEKSYSDWAFPIVLVEKKDGSIRLCVDYRELNKCIKQDSYPIPTIDAILASLAGKKYFSTLDMCSGYWQIPLEESSKHKSAFTTPEGLYQFRVTPFGLSTSPAVFQRLMDTVLKEMLGEEVFCYIDDVMICTDTRERHVELLQEICDRMRKAGLRLKAKKCILLQTSVSFLGHVIDSEGLHMDKQKIEVVRNYPTTKNAKDLRSFLGMASFYRKFCLNFSKIAAPLFKLTSSKTKWYWEDEHANAFQKMKEMISSSPVLKQPRIEDARSGKHPFVIFTDASSTGIGAVLSQEHDDKFLHPIYFASKSLSKTERRYHITDLEALSVIFAIRRFHMFIYGTPTIVKTDHLPLTALFKRTNVSARVLRWSLELQRYNLQIQYIKGRANIVADALSRGAVEAPEDQDVTERIHEAVVCSIKNEESKWLKELQQDDNWAHVINLWKDGKLDEIVEINGMKGPTRVSDFVIEQGQLKMFQEDGSLVLVVPESVRYDLFLEAHAGVLAGHFCAKKVFNKLKKQVFWPEMMRDIDKWTKECKTCFISNSKRVVVPPLKPIRTTKPYDIVGVDILELGRTTSGNRYAVTVIDHFSKFAAAYPVPDKSAETVTKAIFYKWIADGCRWPRVILSDKGTEFENKIMEELEKVANIKHVFTKGYNPRENGITERLNGTIVAMLRKTTKIPTEWDERIPLCMMAYNMSPHSSTGESPYFILHGIDPYCPSNFIPVQDTSKYTIDTNIGEVKTAIMQGIQEIHERVKEKNDRVRAYMKNVYDNEHNVDRAKHPTVGQRVYVECPAEKYKKAHPKLANEWSGPFRVITVSENSALVTRIGENKDPIQIPIDQLRVVPSCFSNERIDKEASRGKRGRRKIKQVQVQRITTSYCRGALLAASSQPGHLLHQCLNECLFKTKLAEISDVVFPGAFANEPVGTVWKAWIACSIFGRKDIDVTKKIKLYRQGIICLDETALKIVLRFAYEKCTEWTEFLCETDVIRKHAPIEEYCVEDMYNRALKEMKNELNEESRETRAVKEGPTMYAAPECAAVLESDGMRGGIQTTIVKTFKALQEKLKEWNSFGIWVIVWPIDNNWEKAEITEITTKCAQHFQEGGRIVSAWTPCSHENAQAWTKMYDVWSTLDETLEKGAGKGQFRATASTKMIDGKAYVELGSPEACWQFYGKYAGVANARYLYENIRMIASSITIPPMHAPPRTSATRRGGMFGKDDLVGPPSKRVSRPGQNA
ncbi:hypothetical protein V3C99_000979, partial [Haemonchus contortus]